MIFVFNITFIVAIFFGICAFLIDRNFQIVYNSLIKRKENKK